MDQATFRLRTAQTRDRLMAAFDLDLLLCYADDIGSAGLVRYLTDFDVYAMYALVAVPRTGDVALAFGLHHSAYLVRVRQAAVADHYLGTYAPGSLCRQLLDESGPGSSPRVGVVGGRGMFRRIDCDLRRALDGSAFVEISADEASCAVAATAGPTVRADAARCATIARDAIDAAAQDLAPTRCAVDIAARAALIARRRGADISNREIVDIRCAAGPSIAAHLAPPDRSEIGAGGGIAIEVAPRYRGLRTSCGRTLVLDGTWSEDLERAGALHERVLALLQPGRTGDAVVRDARRLYERAGIALGDDADLGHGAGFQDREAPFLRAGSRDELRAGSLVVVRTRTGGQRSGTVHLSDTIVVGDDGPIVLTAPADGTPPLG